MDSVVNVSVSDFSVLSGLPQINQEGIGISSEEYMTEFTINRGFKKLLANDIYIDTILTNYGTYLQNTVKPHIADATIHFPWNDVITLVRNVEGITEDTVIRLPINKSVSYIKQMIKNVPRNLNGHTLLFEFCVPQSAVDDNQSTAITLRSFVYTTIDGVQQLLNPTLTLADRGIVFDNFYGGTLIVTGTTTPVNDYDPDGNVISDFFNNWVTGMSAGAIINNYQYDMIQADSPENLLVETTNQLKSLLTISGTGINVNFAPLSFRNCQCDTYLFRLMCHNTINSSSVSINYDDYDLPTYEDIVMFWPIEGSYSPYVLNNEYISSSTLDYELKLPIDPTTKTTMVLDEANYKTAEVINRSKVYKNPDSYNGEPIQCYLLNESGTLATDNIAYFYFNNDSTNRNAKGFTTAMEFKNFIYNFSDVIYGDVVDDSVKRGITLAFWGNKRYNDTVGMPFLCDINDTIEGTKVYGFELGTNGFISYSNKQAMDDSSNESNELYTVVPEGVIGAGNATLQDTTDQWVLYVIEIEEFYGKINKTDDHINYIEKQNWSSGKSGSVVSELMWQISMKIGYYNEETESYDFTRVTSPKLASDGAINHYNKDTCVMKPVMQPLIDENTNIPNDTVRMFRIGSNYYDTTIASKHVWRGALRNMIIFNQIYSNERKLVGYMKQGIQSYYDWNNKGDLEIIKSIGSNSAIGSLSAFNVKNLDVNNCYLKQHVKSVTFTKETDGTV